MDTGERLDQRGRMPYGWRSSEAGPVVVPEQQAVRSVIRRLAGEDYSYGRIAQLLNQAGLTTASGGQWHSMSVKRVATREMRPILADALNAAGDISTEPIAEIEKAIQQGGERGKRRRKSNPF